MDGSTKQGEKDAAGEVSQLTPFDAILFDFDGVLIDSEPLHCRCWADVLKPLGVTLEWDFYRDHCIGIDDREMLRMMASQSDPPRDWQELWAQYPAKKELFRDRTLSAPPFHPALDNFLATLHRQYKMAVVSSSARAEIEPLLKAGGLRHYFETMVCDKEAGAHKPAPEPYLMAARLLGASNPLVVEDSAAGIASGHAAGFEVLAVRSPADVPDLVLRKLARAHGLHPDEPL
jgi:beta-phosphoglucomutase